MDVPKLAFQDRVQQQTFEQFVDITVLQLVEESVFFQDRVLQRFVEMNVVSGESAPLNCKVQGHNRIRIRGVFWG